MTTGSSDHTGGIPLNASHFPDLKGKNSKLNRKEALIPNCHLITKLCAQAGVKLLSSKFTDAGGQTSVPSSQTSELLVPTDFDYKAYVQVVRDLMQAQIDVTLEDETETTYQVVGEHGVRAAQMPLFNNLYNSRAYRDQHRARCRHHDSFRLAGWYGNGASRKRSESSSS